MTLDLQSAHDPQTKTAGKQDKRASASARTSVSYAAAVVIGALGWSGRPWLSGLALLYPFLYLQSRRRVDALSAVFYYAAATWSVVPAARRFFATGNHLAEPLAIWLALVFLGSLPWLALYSSRLLPLSGVGSLFLLALPPLGLITVAHPLIAAGAWFPGTRWLGVALPIILLCSYRRLGARMTILVLIGSSVVSHIRFQRPFHDSGIVALSTCLGATEQGPFSLDSGARERALQEAALAHPNALVLLPESVLPGWSATRETRWTGTFARLNQQHTGLLLGTTIPIPNTNANRNVLLSLGYTEHFSYVQRIPVPIGMWHFGAGNEGFPLMLRFPPTILVQHHRAAVLVCYEQFLVWAALQSLSRSPDMLLAPSNLYWAAGTPIPAIQHVSAQDWADLWAIPLYEATNR